MKFEIISYDNTFQIGISFARHAHNDDELFHYHLWIDIGWFSLELTVGEID